MRRIELSLSGVKVKFVDRDQALRQVEEWAVKGTYPVQVIYGPEGCGKTAWLRQSVELLKELGFDVIYLNPIEKELVAETGVTDVKTRLAEILREATENTWVRIAWVAVDMVREIMRAGARKVAVLVDDVFQAIGLDKAAIYVKGLLGLIEYPPKPYDAIITVAATSEGLSRREIGRHIWAYTLAIWNMTKDGFRQLYEQLPGNKPDFDTIWRLTGGNPRLLGELYRTDWSEDRVLDAITASKKLKNLIANLSTEERAWLREAIEDPDTLFTRERMKLLNRLVELNLVIDDVPYRKDYLWIDQPPPGKDPELGIGENVAWQSPMHREAVRRVLEP